MNSMQKSLRFWIEQIRFKIHRHEITAYTYKFKDVSKW